MVTPGATSAASLSTALRLLLDANDLVLVPLRDKENGNDDEDPVRRGGFRDRDASRELAASACCMHRLALKADAERLVEAMEDWSTRVQGLNDMIGSRDKQDRMKQSERVVSDFRRSRNGVRRS